MSPISNHVKKILLNALRKSIFIGIIIYMYFSNGGKIENTFGFWVLFIFIFIVALPDFIHTIYQKLKNVILNYCKSINADRSNNSALGYTAMKDPFPPVKPSIIDKLLLRSRNRVHGYKIDDHTSIYIVDNRDILYLKLSYTGNSLIHTIELKSIHNYINAFDFAKLKK